MPKAPTLPTITGQYASASQLNAAFRDIETSFENTVSLDGSTPNALTGDLDVNGNDIINVGSMVVTGTLTVDGEDLSSLVTAAAEASAAAAAAAVSETNAAASEAYVASVEASLPDWQGAWLTATAYATGDLVRESGSVYICLVAHTSGTFATDLSAVKWELFAQKGAAGAGTGDMIAANNLSDVASPATSLVNLGLTATAAELNTLDGITASVAELNVLDGITATVSELNVLDGITSTVTELNHTDGVTSNIQTQLDLKAPLASPTFTGTPAAPTATAGTNTTQVATTAFVTTAVAGVGSTGGTEFIETQDYAGTATGDFVLPSGYDAYKLVFANVIPASAADLWVRTSTDGGSIYDTGGSAYSWAYTPLGLVQPLLLLP